MSNSVYNPNNYYDPSSGLTQNAADQLYLSKSDIRLPQITSITAGTASASKALVLDASKNISGINSFSASSITPNITDSANSSISCPFAVTHTLSSGSPTNNAFGISMTFNGPNQINNIISYGRIYSTCQLQTSGLHQGSLTLSSVFAGNFVDVMTISTLTSTNNNLVSIAGTSSVLSVSSVSSTSLTGTLQTAAQPNITSVGTLTSLTSSGNITSNSLTSSTTLTLGSTTISETEIAVIDSITAGTASASKALVLDSNRDITNIRNISTTGTLAINSPASTIGTLSIGSVGTALQLSYGSQANVYGTLTCDASANIVLTPYNNASYNSFYFTTQGWLGLNNFNPRSNLDLGQNTSNCLITLQQTSNLTGTYMLGVNNSAVLYTSAGSNGHRFYYNSASGIGSPQQLGTQVFQIKGDGNVDVTSGIASLGYASRTSGSGCFMHYTGKGEIFSYNYSTATYKDLSFCGGSLYYNSTSGYWGVNNTSPIAALSVYFTNPTSGISRAGAFGYLSGSGSGTASSFTNRLFCIYSEGGILCNSGEIDVMSDIRIKHDINLIDDTIVDKFINDIKVKTFKKNNDPDKKLNFGFIAQEVAKISPDLVSLTIDDNMAELIDEDGFVSPAGFKFSITQGYIIALLTRKIQLQEAQIKQNSEIIEELRKKLV